MQPLNLLVHHILPFWNGQTFAATHHQGANKEADVSGGWAVVHTSGFRPQVPICKGGA